MLARRALAAAPNGVLQLRARDLHAAADDDVVDRDAGVLAEEVLGVLRDADVGDHGAEHPLRGRVRLVRGEAREALLDVGREHLQRAHIEIARDFFHLFGIDLQRHHLN